MLLQPRRDYYAIAAALDRYYLIGHLNPHTKNRNKWVSLRLQEQQINRRRWWLVRSTRCEENDWNKTTGSGWCFLSQTARWRPTAFFRHVQLFCFVRFPRPVLSLTYHLVTNARRKTKPMRVSFRRLRVVFCEAKRCYISLATHSERSEHW